MRGVVAVVALLVVSAGVLTGCTPGPRVVILGDSITIEAKSYPGTASILKGYSADWRGAKYMTSPCNGIAFVKTLTYVPDIVVVNYAGNRGSYQDNCMAGESGDALAARYRKDVQWLINHFRNGKTKVVIVGAPVREGELAGDNLVFTALQQLAADPSNAVKFFDGGRYITPDRTRPTRAATCLSSETGSHCGTSADPKKNYIRDANREHLCPTGGTLNGTCDMYSSGAYRLALHLPDALKHRKVPRRAP